MLWKSNVQRLEVLEDNIQGIVRKGRCGGDHFEIPISKLRLTLPSIECQRTKTKGGTI